NQVIVTPTAAFLFTANGRAQFPDAIVRDNTLGNPGPILRVNTVPSNNPLAYQLYRGIDFGVKYALRNTRAGDFRFGADVTQIIKAGTDNGLGAGFFDNTGYYFNPRWKATASTSWSYKDYGASITGDYTHHYYNDNYTAQGWGENPYTLFSTSVRYSGLWNSTISIGANNVLNNRPPANGRETTGFDPNAYGAGALGRFLYIRVRKDF
ncbi:MAG: hypothetical protein NTV51_26775, partial [Verrucomicrobia bacterium]|nr:hypothetical protein [Verrucomicrobiota bacterium]